MNALRKKIPQVSFFRKQVKHAQIAQLVEQRTENPRVAGSIPALGIFILNIGHGTLAQAVEHLTFNQGVRGSSPRCLINITTFKRSFFFDLMAKFRTVILYGS